MTARSRVFDVSRQGHYAYASRPPSRRVLAEARLCDEVREVFADSRETLEAARAQLAEHARADRG